MRATATRLGVPYSLQAIPPGPPRAVIPPLIPPRAVIPPLIPPRAVIPPLIPPRAVIPPLIPPRAVIPPLIPPRGQKNAKMGAMLQRFVPRGLSGTGRSEERSAIG